MRQDFNYQVKVFSSTHNTSFTIPYDEECDILYRNELAKEIWQHKKNGNRERMWYLVRSYHRRYPFSLTALRTHEHS